MDEKSSEITNSTANETGDSDEESDENIEIVDKIDQTDPNNKHFKQRELITASSSQSYMFSEGEINLEASSYDKHYIEDNMSVTLSISNYSKKSIKSITTELYEIYSIDTPSYHNRTKTLVSKQIYDVKDLRIMPCFRKYKVNLLVNTDKVTNPSFHSHILLRSLSFVLKIILNVRFGKNVKCKLPLNLYKKTPNVFI